MLWEFKQRYNGYRVEQYNVIIEVLRGYSKHLEKWVTKLLGADAEVGHLKHFEHCQNIEHKYLVRALRTPVLKFFLLQKSRNTSVAKPVFY